MSSKTTTSRIDSNIQYTEKREIEDSDKGHVSSVYIINLFDTHLEVAVIIGKYKFVGRNTNVVFFPIYIMSNKQKIKSQIGVYETTTTQLTQILDEDGEPDIGKLGEPLLYSFATPAFIDRCNSDPKKYINDVNTAAVMKKEETVEKKTVSEDKEDEDDFLKTEGKEAKQSILKNRGDVFDKTVKDEPVMPLHPESEDDDIQIRAKYKSSETNEWIERFLRNNNYSITDTDSNGDCFFDSLRLAFRTIGKHTTIHKLRQVVAEKYTDSKFKERKLVYENIQKEEKSLLDKIDTIKDEIDVKKRAMQQLSATREEYETKRKKLETYISQKKLLLGKA